MAAEGKLCHLPVNDGHFIPTARPSVDTGNSAGGPQGEGLEARDANRAPRLSQWRHGWRMEEDTGILIGGRCRNR